MLFRSSSNKIELPQVTLGLACDNDLEGAARVLRHSQKKILFGDVQLFSSSLTEEKGFRLTKIMPINSGLDYSRFVFKELSRHVHTPHILIIQTDGYVVGPEYWRNSFLKYDYIGAPWWEQKGIPPGTVGNGGFSLRSKRFLECSADFQEGHPEDGLLCMAYRPILEKKGMRFAPTSVAQEFSCEDGPYRPAFGFHSRWTMDRVPGHLLAQE